MRTLILLLLAAPLAAQSLDRASPFEGVRWDGAVPSVMVKGKWYRLVSLDETSAEEIVAFCKKAYDEKWQKRFEEDLVPALRAMGRPVKSRDVLLVVEDGDGTRKEFPRVRLLKENRKRLRDAGHARRKAGRRGRVRRVSREHATPAPRELRSITQVVRCRAEATRVKLSAEQAAQDLDQLEWLLEDQYSYLTRKGADYRAALDAVRSASKGGTDAGTFAIRLMKVLALFGDGHTRVAGSWGYLPAGFAPFLLARDGKRWLALENDRNEFLDPDHPYLEEIDGKPVGAYVDAVQSIVPRGSPQQVEFMSLRRLMALDFARSELGLPYSPAVALKLASEDGTKRIRRSLRLLAQPQGAAGGPRRDSRLLEGGFGYLRLREMDGSPAFLAALAERMKAFRDTNGLVLDLRGNGGGSREPLRTLLPYFMEEGGKPWVANVARYRLPRGVPQNIPDGYLANRFLYPVRSGHWSGAERKQLTAFAAAFRPEWDPAEGFSDWHFMLIRSGGAPYRYDRPVVVLMDGGCFSATDIFLGAFKGRKNVTLMGTASGGGSGRSRNVALLHSGIRIRISSMASFRRDGKLYDGRGIEPDVVLLPTRSDRIAKTDTLLEAARKHLVR